MCILAEVIFLVALAFKAVRFVWFIVWQSVGVQKTDVKVV